MSEKSDLNSIKEHLLVLNLNPAKVPSLKEYKAAYRELMKLHPDLGGDTTRFQEITLAANFYEIIKVTMLTPMSVKVTRAF